MTVYRYIKKNAGRNRNDDARRLGLLADNGADNEPAVAEEGGQEIEEHRLSRRHARFEQHGKVAQLVGELLAGDRH